MANYEERDAWVVYTNTDLTEGRGYQFPLYVCNKKATAIRLAKKKYVQGTDAPVEPVKLLKVGGEWFGPVVIQQATREDDQVEERMTARDKAVAKARAAGLTEDDIAALRAQEPK